MASPNSAQKDVSDLFADLKDIASQQKVDKCNLWLENNAGHPCRSIVEGMRDISQEWASIDQALASIDQKLASKSLVSIKKNFPAKFDRTASGPHISKNHVAAKVSQLKSIGSSGESANEKDCLSLVAQNWLGNKFWGTTYPDRSRLTNCSSESDAQLEVVLLLQTIISGLVLDDFVEVVQNRTLAGSECDVLLIYKPNYLPFAVIEVKKPCNTKEYRQEVWYGKKKKGNVVAGQVFDAMTSIRLFGFSRVCGMIATLNHWRLVGTYTEAELDNLGTADEKLQNSIKQETESKATVESIVQQFQQQNSQQQKEGNGDSSEQRKVELTSKTEENMENSNIRSVWASNIVPSFDSVEENDIFHQVRTSGESIVSLVSLFVVKACRLLLEYLQNANDWSPGQVISIAPKMPCRILSEENENTFAFGTITLENLNLHAFNTSLQNLHVIHHLGMGEFGNCCLAVSNSGASCCAIKFYHQPSAQQMLAENELENWRKVYGNLREFPLCRILKAAEGYCLVMPYLHPIPKEKWLERLNNGSIHTALQTFASSGYKHDDVKWRHLGLWKDRVVLFDLGSISKLPDDKGARKTWCENALDELRMKAPSPPPHVDKTPGKNGKKRKRRNADKDPESKATSEELIISR